MRDLVQLEPSFLDVLEPGERVLWHSQPGAGALFLSVVPRMLRDLVFLAAVLFALLAARPGEIAPWNLALIAGLAALLLWLLYCESREATASAVSHYLITDRRLLSILPRAWDMKVRSVWQSPVRNGDRTLARIVAVRHGAIRGGRATVRIKLRDFTGGINTNVRVWGTRRLGLYGVSEPETAVQLLGKRI